MVQSNSPMLTFTPSERLIQMFVEGARKYLERAQTSGDEELRELLSGTAEEILDLSPTRVSEVISATVQDVLISLGGLRQAGALESDVVAKEAFVAGAEEGILEL